MLTDAMKAKVAEAVAQHGKQDERGHVTRFSDSSLYDEKCVLCSLTDGSLMWPTKHTTYNTDCTHKQEQSHD